MLVNTIANSSTSFSFWDAGSNPFLYKFLQEIIDLAGKFGPFPAKDLFSKQNLLDNLPILAENRKKELISKLSTVRYKSLHLDGYVMPDRSKSLGALVQFIDPENGQMERRTLFLLQAAAGKSRELAAMVLNFLVESRLVASEELIDVSQSSNTQPTTPTSSSRQVSVASESTAFENALRRDLYKIKIQPSAYITSCTDNENSALLLQSLLNGKRKFSKNSSRLNENEDGYDNSGCISHRAALAVKKMDGIIKDDTSFPYYADMYAVCAQEATTTFKNDAIGKKLALRSRQ